MKDQPGGPETLDFSLIRGGPWYRLQSWLRLIRPDSLMVAQRAGLYALLAWAPLAILTAMGGTFQKVSGGLSFLEDISVHVRFLVALPVLVLAELPIERFTCAVVAHLQVTGTVGAEGKAGLTRWIRSTHSLRDSWVVAGLIVGLSVFGGWSRTTQTAPQLSTWFASPAGAGAPLSPAGYWLGIVATPLFLSILLRDLLRFLLWTRFLILLARTPLELSPAHPDGMGGLGSLQLGQRPFAMILFAVGAIFSATIANQVLHNGAHLLDFKMLAASLVVIAVIIYVAPLAAFAPQMIACKRRGLLEYEHLAGDYTRGFERKWMTPGAEPSEPLLGTADIQSLADIGNAFERVEGMRSVPLDSKEALTPALAVGVPLLPLALMVMPMGDLLALLMKALV